MSSFSSPLIVRVLKLTLDKYHSIIVLCLIKTVKHGSSIIGSIIKTTKTILGNSLERIMLGYRMVNWWKEGQETEYSMHEIEKQY